MSEPLKKPGPAPERYTSKQVPVIIGMAEELLQRGALAGGGEPASQIDIFRVAQPLYLLGRAARVTHGTPECMPAIDALIEAFDADDVASAIPDKVSPVIPFGVGLDHIDHGGDLIGFTYVRGILVRALPPADQLPEGLIRHIIPAGYYARNRVRAKNIGEALGAAYVGLDNWLKASEEWESCGNSEYKVFTSSAYDPKKKRFAAPKWPKPYEMEKWDQVRRKGEESYTPKELPEIVNMAQQTAAEMRAEKSMEPVKFFQKDEILLGGFHAGSGFDKRWDKYEQAEKCAKLTNMVDGAAFERRIYSPEGINMFTGVEVTDRNILPNYELLVIPPSRYAVFEIDCDADIDRQFEGMDQWLADHQDKYKRIKWDGGDADYIILWGGRYTEEKIYEIWVPVLFQAPESYTPKVLPEIMKLAENAHNQGEGPDASQIASAGGGGSNRLPGIRGLCDGMKGHNYGLPDCLKFVLERMGEPGPPDFWEIAALTGDTVAQVYNRNRTNGCEYCVSGYLAGPEHIAYAFDALGCGHEYVAAAQLNADKAVYLKKLMTHIDSSLPVLVKTNLNDMPGIDTDVLTYFLFVGYENGGETLLSLCGHPGEGNPVQLIPFDTAGEIKQDWIFPGEKQHGVTLEELYRKAIRRMPHWLTLPETDGMLFGAAAYRAWADDIEAGRYEGESDLWGNYGVYVCNLATSGGEPTYLFHKLADLNPAYTHLAALGEKIQALLPAETPTGGKSLLWLQLDELGGGMDLDDVKKTMGDEKKRVKIAAALRDYAGRLDQALALMKEAAA